LTFLGGGVEDAGVHDEFLEHLFPLGVLEQFRDVGLDGRVGLADIVNEGGELRGELVEGALDQQGIRRSRHVDGSVGICRGIL
jgi:hypothetical protein